MMGGSNPPPRSASYLHRHRRNSNTSPIYPQVYPMASMDAIAVSPAPVADFHTPSKDPRANQSLHQSPPPTDNLNAKIPTGAVISPPDSSSGSSDEEENGERRGRDLGKLEAELKEAIRNIPQHREPSPDSLSPEAREGKVSMDDSHLQPPRRKSPHHQRSTSDASYLVDIARSGGPSRSGSEYDIEDDDYRISQPMVRKKSGELVKSSLKSPGRSRPVSMPSTPTFSKNVHFDSQMEHVRHFLHSEKPSAVSAGSSPVELAFDGDSEYPFYDDADQIDWEIILPNFPKDHEKRKTLPVRVEKVCLSTDQKSLIGTVAVANLAFQKHVVARFTFDYWQTVSEVTGEFSNDVRRREMEDGVDRFVFRIKLAEQANLEKKTLFFCICYRTAGQEYWDNNNGYNFQVDFKTKPKTASSMRPKRAPLPRSKQVSTNTRPRSMPNMDDFDFLSDAYLKQAQQVRNKDDPRSPRSVKKPEVNNGTKLPARRANPSGNAFGNRYDFGASLDAAIKAATAFMGPQYKGKLEKDASKNPENPSAPAYFDVPVAATDSPVVSPALKASEIAVGPVGELKAAEGFFNNEKPSIESPSYRELLDNYCFFGSKAPTKAAPKESTAEKKNGLGCSVQLQISPSAEKPMSPSYTLATYNGSASPPAMTLAQHAASGNASPIPVNYAGYRHTRRPSGAFRFDATKTPTAIC